MAIPTTRIPIAGASTSRNGAVSGIIGAIVYTAYAEAVNVANNGMSTFVFPFRQIAAMALGPEALAEQYNLPLALAVGSVIHFALGAVFGIVIAWTARLARLPSAAIIALGVCAGLGLYALAVLVVFPAAFPWFLANSRIVQTIGHAIFGAITGTWLVMSGAGPRVRR